MVFGGVFAALCTTSGIAQPSPLAGRAQRTIPANDSAPWHWTGELAGMAPTSAPQRDRFAFGGAAALGAYRTLASALWGGLRVRGGLLLDGDPPTDPLAQDAPYGSLTSVQLAARAFPLARWWNARGPWLEIAGGGAWTGAVLRPGFELGVGYAIPLKEFSVGPFARYLQVVQPEGRTLDDRDARIALIGIEVLLASGAPAPRPRPAPISLPEPAPDAPPPPRPSPDAADLAAGRLVLDESILFETGEATLTAEGRTRLAGIARALHLDPTWLRLTVEGHADVRGSEAFNQRLSQRRADTVRQNLIGLGLAPERIEAIGYGESRPLSPAQDENAHRSNRRVEFRLTRPEAEPPPPAAEPVAENRP